MPSGPRPAPLINVVKLDIETTCLDASGHNIVWYDSGPTTPEPTSAQLTTLANEVMTAWATMVGPLSATSSAVASVTATYYPSGGGLVSEGVSTHGAISGTGGAYAVPANTAVCVSWQTGLYYRGGKPRSYLFGISSGDVPSTSIKYITTADAALLQANAQTFLTTIQAYNWTVGSGTTNAPIGTVSFAKDKAWRTPPVFETFTGARVNVRLDSQRRRLGKV